MHFSEATMLPVAFGRKLHSINDWLVWKKKRGEKQENRTLFINKSIKRNRWSEWWREGAILQERTRRETQSGRLFRRGMQRADLYHLFSWGRLTLNEFNVHTFPNVRILWKGCRNVLVKKFRKTLALQTISILGGGEKCPKEQWFIVAWIWHLVLTQILTFSLLLWYYMTFSVFEWETHTYHWRS